MNNSNSTKSRSSLRDRFQAGDKPSQSDFSMIFDQTIHQQEDKIVAIKESGGVSLTIGENEKDKLLVKSKAVFEQDLTARSVVIGENTSGNLLVKSDATFEKDLTIGSVATDGSEQGKLVAKNDATFKKGLNADSVTINGIGQGALLVKGGATFEKDLTIGSLATDGSGQGKLLVKNDATFEKNLTSKTLTIGNGTTISQVINTGLGTAKEENSALATVNAIREYVTDNAVGLTQYDNAEAVITANMPINDGASGYKGIPDKEDAIVDGVSLKESDLVLLTKQSKEMHNCLWKISEGPWTKQEKLQTGSAVFIKQGHINGGTLWIMNSTDITKPQWVRRADLDYLKAGAGLNKDGQTLSLKTPANSGLICDVTNGITINLQQDGDKKNISGLTCGEKGVAIHLQTDVDKKNISGLICDNSGLALNIQQLFVFLPQTATPEEIETKLKAGAILVGTYKAS